VLTEETLANAPLPINPGKPRPLFVGPIFAPITHFMSESWLALSALGRSRAKVRGVISQRELASEVAPSGEKTTAQETASRALQLHRGRPSRKTPE
jgi:hypothetical protein